MRYLFLSFVCIVLFVACDNKPKTTTSWKRTTRVKVLDTAPQTSVGTALVMDGQHALVSGRGDAQVYALVKSGARWRLNHQLPSVGRAKKKDHFGSTMLLRGALAVVGAPEHQTTDAPAEGAVHVYRSDAKGSWQHQQHLKGPKQAWHFGVGLALHQGKLWVAANQVVFVYKETPTKQWVLEQTIALPKSSSRFDNTISKIVFAGDDLVVSIRAGQGEARSNRLYIYRATTPNQWALHQTLDTPFADVFLTRGVVANRDTIALPCNAGKHNTVLIYKKDPNGKWQQTSKIEPGVPQKNSFGMQLVLRDEALYISTTSHQGRAMRGAIYHYRQHADQYYLHETLTSIDAASYFGRSFDVQGEEMLVGANNIWQREGEQYVYHYQRAATK